MSTLAPPLNGPLTAAKRGNSSAPRYARSTDFRRARARAHRRRRCSERCSAGLSDVAQIAGGVDQRQMREAPAGNCRPGGALRGSYCSLNRPRSLRSDNRRSNSRTASSRAADHQISIDQPEAAGQEHALARRQAVVGFCRCRSAAPGRRAVSSRSIASHGADDARVIGRQEADRRQQQQAGVELLGAVGLRTKLPSSSSKPRSQTSSWMRSRISRQRSTGPGSSYSSALLMARSKATQAIALEWVKCWRPAAHLPDALVAARARFFPDARGIRAASPSRPRWRRARLAAPDAARPSPRRKYRAATGCARHCRCAPAASLRSPAATALPIRSAAARRECRT